MKKILFIFLFFLFSSSLSFSAEKTLSIGSKNFTENRLIAEMMAELLEDAGYKVKRKFGLEGTLIAYTALINGEIDLYPEYSGTIEQAILKLSSSPSYTELQNLLREKHGLQLLDPLGFNNTYALAVRSETAEEYQLKTIADLQGKAHLQFGFSNEFLKRNDGWPGLSEEYKLTAKPKGMQHGLAYDAIASGKIDITDAYSTDSKIVRFDLHLLEDNKHYFPNYFAAALVRKDIPVSAASAIQILSGRIDDERMQALNAEVELEGKSFEEVASQFLKDEGLIANDAVYVQSSWWQTLALRTAQHLKLSFIALFFALCVSLPLGIFIFRFKKMARPLLYASGVAQTIPSIALLAIMIPLFGIGQTPAIIALFIYSLLPILRNTAIALFSIDPRLRKVSIGMGLTAWQRLRYVELPIAMPTILAGIKTAAVINIGTATLAAFIGAGGLGEPIVTGLALNDTGLILEGAIPAAILAILTELSFELLERKLVPKHLLQKQAL